MKINLKIATLDDANMIGEVFDLYRIFYNQVSDISVAQQYICLLYTSPSPRDRG